MNRLLYHVAAGVSTLLLLTQSLEAQNQKPQQRRGQFQGAGFGAGELLQNSSVQQELKMTEEQIKKVTGSMRELYSSNREELQKLERKDRAEKMRSLTNKFLADTLNADQMKRFKQIELQVGGPEVMADAKVQEALKVNEEQKAKIMELSQEVRKQVAELGATGGRQRGANPEAMKKFLQLRKDTKEKALALLTEDQKKSWKDLTGEPFEMKPQALRRRPNNNP